MKTKGSSNLTAKQRKEIVLNLCRAMTTLRSSQEMADALSDLLTPKEIETIAKRLQIAEFLVKGEGYDVIRKSLNVGYSTIARINTWLNVSGEGFRMMLTRKKQSPKIVPESERYDPMSWYNIKRRYSLNFWPQLLLDELVRNADTAEKKKIEAALEKISMKASRLSKQEHKRLYDSFREQLHPFSK